MREQRFMKSSNVFLLMLIFVVSAVCALLVRDSLFSAEPRPAEPPPAPAAPRDVVREKTVYVPYEKLKEIFEKEGRGIFLPYDEFLKLWEASQPKPPEPPPDLPPAAAVIRGGAYSGAVAGEVARFVVTFEIEALKKGWSELTLPFKGVAMESVELSSPEAIFSSKGPEYSIILPAPGHYRAKLQFSARVDLSPGKKTVAFGIPPVAVSRLDLSIPEEEVRVQVQPALAVTQTAAKDKSTTVLAFLGNSTDFSVSWMPPAGKLVQGGAVLLGEQSIRAYLGERILRISTDIAWQVLRGEVDALKVRVPEGMRLLSVKGDNIREWAQEADLLTVKLHSALKDPSSRPGGAAADAAPYRLSLSFERILAETPPSLTVTFPRAEDVIRESGWVVFAHEPGLNVRLAETRGLSQLDKDEVPEALRPSLGVGFRYLAQPLTLGLAIEKITPSIQSAATSVAVLGAEEDTWVGWIDYTIAKAGVFRLELRVPARWSVASMGDPSTVENFQAVDGPDGVKAIAVNLKSRALGAFRLPFRLTAAGSGAAGEATLSPPVVAGSLEDRGLFAVSAPKALSLSTVERQKMSSADVEALFKSGIMTQVGADTSIPLTYSYREQPASVKVRLEAKKTEIDVLAQHLVEISDSGIKLTHILDYDVLYAAVDRLSFTAPSDLDGVLKVEAEEKKEVRKVSSDQGRTVWEVILQAPALGGVSITVTHEQMRALEPGKPFEYPVPFIHARDAREKQGFVALRKEGTLEIVPRPAGMEAVDAGDLPDKLRRGQIYGAFRYFTPDPSLSLSLTRYEFQQLATTVVNLMRLKSVLSEERRMKTRATLIVQNTDRQYLELKLSREANILSVSVDGKPEQPRKRQEGAGTLIRIPPSAGPGGAFPVVIVYEEPLAASSMGAFGTVGFFTPEVLGQVPVSKIEEELYVSPEYAYLAFGGSLKPRSSAAPGLWTRFKSLVDAVVLGQKPAPATSQSQAMAAPPLAGAAVDVEIPTGGYVLCSSGAPAGQGSDSVEFETLASTGSLGFAYIGRTLFAFLDFLAFVAAIAGAYFLVVRARRRMAGFVACVFLPLVLVWFSKGAIVDFFTSLLAGGVAFFLGFLAVRAWKGMKEMRAARKSPSPDPYLEEAVVPAPAAPPAGPAAPAATPEGK
jgi:hypothetical protein